MAVDMYRAALAVCTATDRAALAVPQSYTHRESCSQRGSRHGESTLTVSNATLTACSLCGCKFTPTGRAILNPKLSIRTSFEHTAKHIKRLFFCAHASPEVYTHQQTIT